MWLASTVAMCSGGPSATIVPPPVPPPGPRSITQSAVLITSRLCSITSTVLPWSTRRWSTVSSRRTSSKCRPGGRLVEEVDRVTGRSLGELGRQLHALRLAARQRRRRLAEPDVSEPDVDERLHVARDARLVGEEVDRLGDRHVEHVGDVLALELDVERVAVVPGALAHLARHVHVGQEVHLDLQRAVAGARLAAAALDVEAEPARHVAAHLRLVGRGEQLADAVEHAGVRGRVGPRRAPDRRLVHVDHLVEQLDAGDPLVLARRHLRRVDPLHQHRQQDVADQRRLARTRHTGDGDEVPERDLDRRGP